MLDRTISHHRILETKIQQHQEDERFHSSLGIAYAGLGRKEDALREGKLGVKLLFTKKSKFGHGFNGR